MTYTSVFGRNEVHEVLNMLSRKAHATLLVSFQSAVVLHKHSNTMTYDTNKSLLNDPVMFYDNSHQDLKRDY